MQIKLKEELDLGKVWKSITNVWDVTKLVFKDILNTSATLIKITFMSDPKKIKEEMGKWKQRKRLIDQKILAKVEEIRKDFGPDFQTVLFITNPGLYLTERTLFGVGPELNKLNLYFEEAGIKISDLPPMFLPGTPEGDEQLATRMRNALQGNISPYENVADFDRDAKRINQQLSKIIGISGKVNESITDVDDVRSSLNEARKNEETNLIELAKESTLEGMKEFFKTADQSALIDKSAKTDYLKFKEEELNRFIKILNVPISFSKKMAEAASLEDFKKVLNEFEAESFYKVEGLDDQKEKELINVANQLFKESKKQGKKSIEKVIQAAGSNISAEKITDEELKNLCRLVVARSSFQGLIESLQNPDQNFIESQNQMKEDFKKSFSDGMKKEDFIFLNQSEEGKKIAEFIRSGINKIDSAGL